VDFDLREGEGYELDEECTRLQPVPATLVQQVIEEPQDPQDQAIWEILQEESDYEKFEQLEDLDILCLQAGKPLQESDLAGTPFTIEYLHYLRARWEQVEEIAKLKIVYGWKADPLTRWEHRTRSVSQHCFAHQVKPRFETASGLSSCSAQPVRKPRARTEDQPSTSTSSQSEPDPLGPSDLFPTSPRPEKKPKVEDTEKPDPEELPAVEPRTPSDWGQTDLPPLVNGDVNVSEIDVTTLDAEASWQVIPGGFGAGGHKRLSDPNKRLFTTAPSPVPTRPSPVSSGERRVRAELRRAAYKKSTESRASSASAPRGLTADKVGRDTRRYKAAAYVQQELALRQLEVTDPRLIKILDAEAGETQQYIELPDSPPDASQKEILISTLSGAGLLHSEDFEEGDGFVHESDLEAFEEQQHREQIKERTRSEETRRAFEEGDRHVPKAEVDQSFWEEAEDKCVRQIDGKVTDLVRKFPQEVEASDHDTEVASEASVDSAHQACFDHPYEDQPAVWFQQLPPPAVPLEEDELIEASPRTYNAAASLIAQLSRTHTIDSLVLEHLRHTVPSGVYKDFKEISKQEAVAAVNGTEISAQDCGLQENYFRNLLRLREESFRVVTEIREVALAADILDEQGNVDNEKFLAAQRKKFRRIERESAPGASSASAPSGAASQAARFPRGRTVLPTRLTGQASASSNAWPSGTALRPKAQVSAKAVKEQFEPVLEEFERGPVRICPYTEDTRKVLVLPEYDQFEKILLVERKLLSWPQGRETPTHPRLVEPWGPQKLGGNWLRNIAIDINRCYDGSLFSDSFPRPSSIPEGHKRAVGDLIAADFVPFLFATCGASGKGPKARFNKRSREAEEVRRDLCQYLNTTGFVRNSGLVIDGRVLGPRDKYIGIVDIEHPVQRQSSYLVTPDVVLNSLCHTQISEGKAFECYNCNTFIAIEDRADICEEYAKCGILAYQVWNSHNSRNNIFELRTDTAKAEVHVPSCSFEAAVSYIISDRRSGALQRKAEKVWKDRLYY